MMASHGMYQGRYKWWSNEFSLSKKGFEMMKMSLKCLSFLLFIGMMISLKGCGNTPSAGDGAMTVRLVDAPVTGYKEININVQEVQINQGDSGWITLSNPNTTVNLLTLTGGVSETLVDSAALPAGHYDQMRLVLGSGNTVILADDSVHDLKIPSGIQSGLKLVVSFDVEAGTTKDVFIDFDAAHSIMLHQAGNNDKYILRPTIRAIDKVMTGSVTGKLTDTATGAGLAEAIVTAQTLDASGNASIIRSVLTNSDGIYTLDLLPMDAACYIVSQPVIGSVAYEAIVSEPVTLTTETPTATWSAAFTAGTEMGDITGAITPVAAETNGDTINLLQTLTAGSTTSSFIIRTTTGVAADTTESYSFTSVPVGNYVVNAVRTTIESNGTTTVQNSLTNPTVTVPASSPVTADLQF
jgi:hypothetical protein